MGLSLYTWTTSRDRSLSLPAGLQPTASERCLRVALALTDSPCYMDFITNTIFIVCYLLNNLLYPCLTASDRLVRRNSTNLRDRS